MEDQVVARCLVYLWNLGKNELVKEKTHILNCIYSPCRVNEEGTDTFINEYSWNDKANMIFLDQVMTTRSHITKESLTLM
jgi:hypothetical protein